MCVKNTTYNGCETKVYSPTNYTTWVVERVKLPIGKTNTPPRKEFLLAPIKKIATLVLHVCHRIQKRCAYSNYDAIPNILEIEK